MRPVIFLDRDGVINHKAPEGHYVRSWGEFEFLPGAVEALARLSTPSGPALVVVTNQRGIARGHMTRTDVDSIHARMRAVLSAQGATIHGIHVCPHEAGTCDCRKPDIGLFAAAVREDASLDVANAVVVGDSLSDLRAGQRLGASTYLVSADAADLLADAAEEGITVTAHASSLLRLVEDGAFEHLMAVAS